MANVLTGILVFCAILISVMVIRQQFFQKRVEPELVTRTIPEWKELDLKGYHIGSVDAPIQIIEFFDYECPYCLEVNLTLHRMAEKYVNQISVVYEHFPLEIHEHAFEAAVAAECGRLGNRFEEYHSQLFSNQKKLDSISYDSLAVRTGIENLENFKKCFRDRESSSIVQSGVKLGNQLEIGGVPTFLINGKVVPGVLSEKQFDSIIEKILQEKKEASVW